MPFFPVSQQTEKWQMHLQINKALFSQQRGSANTKEQHLKPCSCCHVPVSSFSYFRTNICSGKASVNFLHRILDRSKEPAVDSRLPAADLFALPVWGVGRSCGLIHAICRQKHHNGTFNSHGFPQLILGDVICEGC